MLDAQHGIPTLLASLVIILSLHFLVKVGEFLWKLFEKKNELSEKSVQKLTSALHVNTSAIEKLETRILHAEKGLADMPKFKSDLRKLFAAVKFIAGDEWIKIRQEVMSDEI